MTVSTPIWVYYHLADFPGWELLFVNQMCLLRDSNLMECASKIIVNSRISKSEILNAAWWLDKFPQVILRRDPSITLDEGEKGTLRLLWDDVAESQLEVAVLYWHSKGVTHLYNQNVYDWRVYMEYFCIERWVVAVQALINGHDLAGVNWDQTCYPHFSGNFWWATGKYIKTLKPLSRHNESGCIEEFPSSLKSPRHDAEFWVGSNAPIVKQLHESRSLKCDHYRERYKRSEYILE